MTYESQKNKKKTSYFKGPRDQLPKAPWEPIRGSQGGGRPRWARYKIDAATFSFLQSNA